MKLYYINTPNFPQIIVLQLLQGHQSRSGRSGICRINNFKITAELVKIKNRVFYTSCMVIMRAGMEQVIILMDCLCDF